MTEGAKPKHATHRHRPPAKGGEHAESPSRKAAEEREEKTVVGWSERVDFPDWEIKGLRAKVDTGARTSALHVEDLEVLPGGRVRFDVILNKRPPKSRAWKRQTVTADVLKWALVRSSTGKYKKRCFVKTRVRLGHVEKEIEVSLVSRHKMVFRMLLGRKALEKDFVVDVSRREALVDAEAKAKAKAVAKKKKKIVKKAAPVQDSEPKPI